MRILVVSDTHGDVHALRRAILAQPQAEIIFHLGDGAEDVDQLSHNFPHKMILQVRGNCDFGSPLAHSEEFMVSGLRIFYTHGHIYNVKWEQDTILSAAKTRRANILLYGHTHRAVSSYRDGLYILNPGSLKGHDGSYGYIDLTEAGIVTNIVYKDRF